MVIGTTLIVIAVLVVAIWVIIEVKRFKHKIFALFLIALILFTYISFASVIKGKDLNFKSVDGLKEAGGLYLSWLGSIFGNMKMLTVNAINMDWKANETSLGS
jgi:hypothetical protein